MTTTVTTAPAATAVTTTPASFQTELAATINRALNAAVDIRVAQEMAPLRTSTATTASATTTAAAAASGLARWVPVLGVALVAFLIVRAVRK